jgi:PAS domain S-box-containing protein
MGRSLCYTKRKNDRKGIIETNVTVETFWYRRVTEVAILLPLAVIVIWALSTYVIDEPLLAPLVVSLEAIVVNASVLALASLTMALSLYRRTQWMAAAVIVGLGMATILNMSSTGNMESPYIPLWVVVALFSAVAGLASFVPIAVGLAAYGGYMLGFELLNPAQWVSFGMALVFPLLVGVFIWSKRFQAQEHSSQAVSRLTHELSKESSKASIVINAIADGVIVVDAGGIIQLINPAAERIVGWGKEDATNLDYRSVLKIIDSRNEIVEGNLDPVQQCLSANQSVLTDKFGIRTVSGKQLLASILASPVNATSGGAGVIIVFRDITAQRAEEKGQAEFISTASHEMRTPVAAIEGYLGLALNPQTAVIDDKARMYLMKAHESARHLGQLFQDLLDISKAEDGRLSNKPSIIDVPAFIRNMIETFQSQANEKALTLIYGPDASPSSMPTITPVFYANVDPTHFQEIVTNLLSNAIKYTKEGTVRVDIKGDDEHVYVCVKDSGLGIPAEDLPHLFQKFYRVDNTDTREIGGTGLGLYLSRRLAEAMDGHLTVDSTYGQGSTFTLEVPRVKKEDIPATQTPPAPNTT